MLNFIKRKGAGQNGNLYFLIAFLFINFLFIYKYTPRINLNPFIIIVGYTILIGSVFFFSNLAKNLKPKYYMLLYWASLTLIFIISIILFHRIDIYELKVDRWSTITGFLSKLFSGEYPYLAKTHMGNYASPLPGLFIIFSPFYLTDTISYIQPVFIAIAGISILKATKDTKSALFFNIMVILSPSLWYEIATRSDVFTNLLIVSLFILIYHSKSNLKTLKWPIQIGIITGLLVSTRGLVVIPLFIYFIKPFILSDVTKRVKYLLAAVITLLATILPFYIWSPELFIKLNPLLIQTNRIPFVIQVFVIILAIIVGFTRKKFIQYANFSFLLIFGVMCFALIYISIYEGWYNTIYHHEFDISYFSTSLPFLFFALVFENRNNSHPVIL